MPTTHDDDDVRTEKKRKREDEDGEDEKRKKKRKQVKRACLNCRIAHAACGDERPCKRCLQHGLEVSCFDVERRNAKRLKKNQQDGTLNPATLGLGNLAASYGLANYAADQPRPVIPHHVFLSHNLFPAYQHLATQHAPLIQQVIPPHLYETSPFAPPQPQASTSDFLEHDHEDDDKWSKFLLEKPDEGHSLIPTGPHSPINLEAMLGTDTTTITPTKDEAPLVPSGCVAFPSISIDESEEMCIAVWTLDGKLFSANVQFLQQFKVPKDSVQAFHPFMPNDANPKNSSYIFDSGSQCVNIKQILYPSTRNQAFAILEKVFSGTDLPFYTGEVDCCTFDDNSLLSVPSLLKTLFSMYIVKAGRERQPKYAVSHISVLK